VNLRLRLPTNRLGSRLGWPGALGGAGLALCLALYFAAVQPAQQRLDAAHQSAVSLQTRMVQAGLTSNDSARPLDEQLAAFYRSFPGEHEATDWIGKIAAIAERDGLSLQQAEYKADRDKAGKLTRLQMSLPLKGEYETLRKFLSDLHTEIPIVSLEQVEFERQKIGDPLVDAKLRLVIFLGRAA
jgi:Tfp pilus assembly protein PilO